MLYWSSLCGRLNLPSPCEIHTPNVLPANVDNIMELFSCIFTEAKLDSCFCEVLWSIFPCTLCSGLISSNSMNNWQPLQIPTDIVSGRAKKFSKAFFAFSLYRKAPAQPFAEPNTSELEKPPTVPIN